MMTMFKTYGITGKRNRAFPRILAWMGAWICLLGLTACNRVSGEESEVEEAYLQKAESEALSSTVCGETVTIPEGGITFVIPQGWQYEQRQQGYLNIRPVEQSMVELSVRWFYRTGSVQEYQETLKRAWRETVSDFDETLDVTPASVGALEGFVMTFQQSSDDYKAVCYQDYTLWDSATQMYYNILFVGAQEDFKKNAETVEALLDSFVINPPEAPSTQTYSDAEQGVSFSYDGKWRLLDTDTVTILAPDLLSTISLECTRSQETLSNDAIMEEAEKMILESTSNPRDIVLESTTILGYDGVRGNFAAEYQSYEDMAEAVYQFYIFYAEGMRYYLIYASTPEQFDTYLPELEHVIETLSLA